MLTLDSFSRNHFYRKLERTVAWLQDLAKNSKSHSVFDFKLHNVLGTNTASNIIPILGESKGT
jgi:hypothetical protein